MIPWKDNDKLFKKELIEGTAWQAYPALFFQLHGHKVVVPSLVIRKDISEAGLLKNSVDMFVDDYPFEIKTTMIPFTCVIDHPYQSQKIDTVSGYDAKDTKPIAYILVSKPTGSMLCIESGLSSSKKWSTRNCLDSKRGFAEDWYVAPTTSLKPLTVLLASLKNRP